MELAEKPVRFVCNADAPTIRMSVPKTENSYLFYKDQPYLVKFVLDIEFFDEHLMFMRVDDVEVSAASIALVPDPEPGNEIIVDTTAEEIVEEIEGQYIYSKAELQKMRKSDVRDILKKIAPNKSSPVRKENIISEVLKAQGNK